MEPYFYMVKKAKYEIVVLKSRCSFHTLVIDFAFTVLFSQNMS